MKRIASAFIISLFAMSMYGQKLLDIYQKGTVRLIPDTEYGKGNDWNKVFKTYYDTMYNTPMGGRKSLVIMPDGSVVVNHRYRNYYSRFSPSGRFEKEFYATGQKGLPFKELTEIEGVINNNTFYTLPDNAGNMLCFDFNGRYAKTLKLDYMVNQMISLPNDKIAVVGWVIKKKSFCDFVAIVNYSDNAQKIIWQNNIDRSETGINGMLFHYNYTFKNGKSISFSTMPYLNTAGLSSPPKIECVSDKLIVSIPGTGEILTFTLTGELITKSRINWVPGTISVEEQKEMQQTAIENYKHKNIPVNTGLASSDEIKIADNQILQQMQSDLSRITQPIPLPAFSTIIKDSDDNLLYFEYPKKENANKFNVWICEKNGRFVCQSSFICDEYELNINPSKMVFRDGCIYGLQILKKTSGVPLRLVKFKVSN
ncbi:MAG: hypothetical protein NTU98_06145 [Bacteroidetes bacterium]|nr:hypothetical protein [Bacteroidota bacterium]